MPEPSRPGILEDGSFLCIDCGRKVEAEARTRTLIERVRLIGKEQAYPGELSCAGRDPRLGDGRFDVHPGHS